MEYVISFIIVFGFIGFIKFKIDSAVDNYDCRRVDVRKLDKDVRDGVSVGKRRMRYIQGYYDKDEYKK